MKWMFSKQTAVGTVVGQVSNPRLKWLVLHAQGQKLGRYLIGHLKLEDGYLLGEVGAVVLRI